MIDPLLWVAPLAALAVVAAFGFVGCVGDDPALIAAEQKKKESDAAAVKQASQQYPAVVSTTPNLVAYWRLSEGETGGTVAPDSGPLKKDGQYKNPAGVTRSVAGALSVVADATDKAAEFDGVQGYAEVPYDIVLNPPIYFSVELWVRPPDAPATPQVIAGAYDVDATGVLSRGFVLDIVPGPPPKFRVRLGNATPGHSRGFAGVRLRHRAQLREMAPHRDHLRWRQQGPDGLSQLHRRGARRSAPIGNGPARLLSIQSNRPAAPRGRLG